MEIKYVLETREVEKSLNKLALVKKYRKAKNFILAEEYELTGFKKRKPKVENIWQFKIDKQFRAFCYFDKTTLVVFHIDNHQN